jgi:hypothetical protein
MNGAYSILGKLSCPIKKKKKKKHTSLNFKNSKSLLYFISIFFFSGGDLSINKRIEKKP